MIEEAVEAETLALEIYVATGDRLREGDAHCSARGVRLVPGRRRARRGGSRHRGRDPRDPAARAGARAGLRLARDDVHDGRSTSPGPASGAQKAIDLAERLGETEVLVAATRNVGTIELAHGLAEGREKLLRSLDAGARRAGWSDHAAVAYCNLVSSLARHPRLRRRRWRTSRPAARSATSTTCSPGTSTWAAGRRTSRSTTAAGPRPRRWPRENLERTRGSLPHSRFRSLLVVGRAARPPRRRGPVAGARRGAGDRRRGERAGHARPRRRRAGGGALARRRGRPGRGGDRRRAGARRAQRPSLDDRRARDLAPPRGPAPRRRRAAAAALPGRAHAATLRAAAEFWTARGCRYDAALALGHQRRGGRSAREPARAAGPRRATRRGDRRAAPARARRPRRAARAACRDAGEPRRSHRARSSTCSPC